MKQTAKRILSLVLSLVVMLSAVTVYTFAANNYEPDEDFYNNVVRDSFVVNPDWAGKQKGDPVTFEFASNTYNENFDPNTRFSSIQDAVDAAEKIGENYNPVIVLLPGYYSEPAVIKTSVTFVGPNGGINPVQKSANEQEPWTKNVPHDEARLKSPIVVDINYRKNVEVVFDGVTFYHGFAYIDGRTMAAQSNVVVKNTVINGAGSCSYDKYSTSSVFWFGDSRNINASVEIKDTYIENMSSANVFSTRVTNIDVHDIFYTTSTAGLMGVADGQNDINPSYVVRDSMFYNNNTTGGIISVNYSSTDTTLRTSTSLEVYNCSFIDGTYTDFNEETTNVSPINVTLVGPKNIVNIHDNLFVGKGNYEASAVGFSYASKALTDEMKGTVTVTKNRCYGFVNLPNTAGVNILTLFDFTGNYYADSYGMQKDPVYKYPKSVVNIKLDYFFVDKTLMHKSSDFYISEFGVVGARVDHIAKQVYATLDFTKKINVNIKTNNDKTTFKLYSDPALTQEVTVIDPQTLSLNGNNVFYAQSSSILYPSYKFTYTVYLSTSDPAQAIEFNTPSTYYVSEAVSTYANGSAYYAEWDGITYKFTVGKNAFADTAAIFALGDACPTILLAAGEYSRNIYVTKSAVILGQKHGINPNITDYVNYDKAWEINPERSQVDQETILKNATIVFMPQESGAILEVDGITLGTFSAIDDRNSKENFYSTLIVSNIIIDEAGNASYSDPSSVNVIAPTTIITCAPSSGNKASTNHKTGRFTNIRMVAQKGQPLFELLAENAVFDGIYAEANTPKLFKSEITSPVKQNMHLEIRNSFFLNNTPGDYYFIVNHNIARDADREYSEFIVKNNMFFGNVTSANGIFGVRYGSAQDLTEYTNNIFASTVAKSINPGSFGWYIGAVGNGPNLNAQDIVDQDNIVIKYNRFLGLLGPKHVFPGMTATNEKSRFDLSYNYFNASVARTNEGSAPSPTDSVRHKCDVYFKDWDMKEPSTITPEYSTALDYAINASGVLNGKIYTDSVPASTDIYDFDIELKTPQASYAVYTDASCTNEVAHPVQLNNGQNVFYLKFKSYDETVTDTITATITKAASAQTTGLSAFGTAKIVGNNIFAVVPVGRTTYNIPATEYSAQIFNDSACTQPFTSSVITNVTTVPIIKYVVANGQKYTLSVIQAVNDQAELISVGGGKKTSDTEFKVDILGSDFMLTPVYSDGATLSVTVGSKQITPDTNGNYYISNIATSKTAVVTVTAENGNKKTYNVNIIRGAATSKVVSIFNMTPNGSANKRFDTIVSDAIFKVEPTFEGIGTKYQVYSDKACTQPVQDNIMILSARETTAYLKVTSADGTSTNFVTLNITCTSYPKNEVKEETSAWSIEGATLVPGTTNCYTATADKNAKNFKLVVKLDGKKYKKSYYEAAVLDGGERVGEVPLVNEKLVLPLNGRNTRYYVSIYTCEGEEHIKTERVYLTIVQPQAAVTYADAHATADWAKPYVDYLNNNGFAYFVGDTNKNFNATAGISRFEVAVVVCKMLGINTNYTHSITVPFTDEIPEWALPYVKVCYKLGIMAGKSETAFDGYAKTTRQEFARVISQTIAVSQGDLTPINEIYGTNKALIDLLYTRKGFVDEASVAEWAKPGIRLAVAHYNVMSGSAVNGQLYVNPTNAITRQEVAVLIAKREGA